MSHSFQNKKLKRALMLIKQGRMNEAEKIYRHLIVSGMRNDIVYANLGAILQSRGDKNNAIWFFKKSIEMNQEM